MATLQDLIDDCRSHLDERAAQFWSDDELTRWINEALRDVARRTENLQAVHKYTTVPSQLTYDAPLDLLRIYRVEYHQSDNYVITLEFRDLNSMDDVWYQTRAVPGSQPYWWSYWGYSHEHERGQVYIYPSTSSQVRDGLWVFYYRLPRVLLLAEPGGVADIPSGWEDLVTLYVEMIGRRKDNDKRWTEAQELYEARLEAYISVSRLPTDQMTFFAGGGTGGLPGWLVGGGDW